MDTDNIEINISSTIIQNYQAENDSFDNLTSSTADKQDELNKTNISSELVVNNNITKLDLLIQREKLSFQLKKKPIVNKNYCQYKNDNIIRVFHSRYYYLGI